MPSKMTSPVDNTLWERLKNIRSLQFQSRSNAQTGWDGSAAGTVTVMIDDHNSIRFIEEGTWISIDGISSRFKNIYKWSLLDAHLIRLEHLRYGKDRPVFLCILEEKEQHHWQSQSPHICNKDQYFTSISVKPDKILMHWDITGPEKDEDISYEYV